MAFRLSPRNRFDYLTGNVLTTRPAAAFGTSITGGASNSYGSYTSILAGGSIAYDCYHIDVLISNGATSAVARDQLVTIGIDDTGGTSYVSFIPDLLCASAASTVTDGGIFYSFPLFIKASSQLAAKMQYNDATAGRAANVAVWLRGRPSHPEELIYGDAVEAIGVTAASSSGTVVTPGTTSEGTWTSLGTTTHDCFAWQLGVGINDSTQGGVVYGADLSHGNGSSFNSIIEGAVFNNTSAEAACLVQPFAGLRKVPGGDTLYGRLQCSGTADSNLSMAAYGVKC